jgi:hypothetical protein
MAHLWVSFVKKQCGALDAVPDEARAGGRKYSEFQTPQNMPSPSVNCDRQTERYKLITHNSETASRLVSLNKFLGELGVTSTTGWRWRRKGILPTINIYGRLYLSESTIADFHRRAAAGEFAKESKPGIKKLSRNR